MCGIVGALGISSAEQVVRKMMDRLGHRGPDEEGVHHSENVAFGHTRLSIVDIATGQQPLFDESGDLILICNGEIYNSPQLRTELEAKGYGFKTRSDVEVILPLYKEYGKNCVRHLQGMFAFTLWDKKNRLLLMARDHMGQKPLFYVSQGDSLIFASEVKALLASGSIKPEIDLDGLWHYISLRFLPDRYSLFKSIQKLPAGSILVFENGQCSIERYWEPNFTDKLGCDEIEIESRLDSLLRQTVEEHLLSDVQVGAFLSGGIDSSTITAIMADISGEPFPVFSIGVKEQGFNELPYAKMVSDKYNLKSFEKVVEADLINLIPSMTYHLDEPSDPFAAGVYLVSREASKQVKVVLTGDGGDESFAGYDRFAGNKLVQYYTVIPTWFRKHFMRALIRRIPESFGYKSLAQKAEWFNEMSFYNHGLRYAQSMSFLRFNQDAKNLLFTERARQQVSDSDSLGKILRYYDAGNAEELVDRMLFTDLMTRMPDHLLPIVDRMTMAHSLESRAPLVDYKLVEFAASIPSAMKLKGKNLKYILKKVAERYLPPELIHRKKQGFGFPLALWMRKDLRPFLTNLFQESRFVDLGLFNQGYMNKILEEHVSGRADHNFRLWILINLEVWYRLFFENQSVEDLWELTKRLSSYPHGKLSL